MPIRQFFLAENNFNYMLKKEEQKPFRLEGSSVLYTRLNGEFDGRGLEPMMVTLAPKMKQNPDSHPGEEFCYVLKGTILIKVGDSEYVVREGIRSISLRPFRIAGRISLTWKASC